MITVRDLRGDTSPCHLRYLWQSLWARTPHASFRQMPDFLERQFRMATDPWRILVVSAFDRPVGIVPFLERSLQRSAGTFRVLATPESQWGFLPGIIGPHASTMLTAATRHLLEHDSSWDLIELPEIVDEEARPKWLPPAPEATGLTPFQRRQQLSRSIELPNRWEQFWAERPLLARQRLRELQGRCNRRGEVRFSRFRPQKTDAHGSQDVWSVLELLDSVVRQQPAERADEANTTWHELRETLAAAADAGCADVALLLENSQPIAFAYNAHHNGHVETLQLLTDPRVPDAADLLIGHMLRDEIRRGDTQHLFLPHSTSSVTVDWSMWQCSGFVESLVTYYRRPNPRLHLLRWLDSTPRLQVASSL